MTPSFLKNKKITIIGGAGFIGHNLSLELKKNQAKVTLIDD
jgi:nucleoside-diphosphate-sugar epimerase